MKLTALAATLSLLTLTAQAATFSETGDAGQTLPTAARLNSTLGDNQPLSAISGNLSGPTDADLFQIFITDPAGFSASTVGGSTVDTQLFLFSATGAGVITNDDFTDLISQSLIPVGSSRSGLGPFTAGVYYIGVSTFGYDPRTSTNANVFATGTPTDLLGPNTGTLSQWGGNPFATPGGAYTITLTGATTGPAPMTLLGVVALGGVGSLLKRRK